MIYTLAIQKGGTAKTATAAALVQAAAVSGQKALAIDLDPQGNLSFTLAADAQKPGAFELLNGTPAADVVQQISPELDAIPASWNLQTITSAKGSAHRLQQALKPIKDNYDIIVIDTPATAGELQYNALLAADGLIIPLQADTYSLQALYQITDTARQFESLRICGFVLTQYDGRSTLARQMREHFIIQATAAGIPYLGTIRRGIAVQEAAALQKSLFDYAARSNPAEDYMQLYNTLKEQEVLRNGKGFF